MGTLAIIGVLVGVAVVMAAAVYLTERVLHWLAPGPTPDIIDWDRIDSLDGKLSAYLALNTDKTVDARLSKLESAVSELQFAYDADVEDEDPDDDWGDSDLDDDDFCPDSESEDDDYTDSDLDDWDSDLDTTLESCDCGARPAVACKPDDCVKPVSHSHSQPQLSEVEAMAVRGWRTVSIPEEFFQLLGKPNPNPQPPSYEEVKSVVAGGDKWKGVLADEQTVVEAVRQAGAATVAEREWQEYLQQPPVPVEVPPTSSWSAQSGMTTTSVAVYDGTGSDHLYTQYTVTLDPDIWTVRQGVGPKGQPVYEMVRKVGVGDDSRLTPHRKGPPSTDHDIGGEGG